MKKQLCCHLVLLMLTYTLGNSQNPTLWGMTNGTIFSYNISTSTYTQRYNFTDSGINGYTNGSLLQANDGKLYAMTASGGGQNSGGTIFSYNIATNTITDLHDFNDTDGLGPQGSLMQASNGLIYGASTYGGADNLGTIFSYDIITNKFSHLSDFDTSTNGAYPYGSFIQINDSILYGTCFKGGINNLGVIYSYNIVTNMITPKHSFGSGNDGTYIYGSLLKAMDGLLYGMTLEGGVYDNGTIFNFNSNTDTEIIVHNFNGNSEGSFPQGALIQAKDSLLYGVVGGNNLVEAGIFSFGIPADTETTLYNFSDNEPGIYPTASPLLASDGLLYGITVYNPGASNFWGTIFSYDIHTGMETDLHDFSFNEESECLYGNLIEVDDTFPQPTQLTAISPERFSIFPNPSTGKFSIQLPEVENNYHADVFNVLGQNVYSLKLNCAQNMIDLTNMPAGTYFIRLYLQKGVIQRSLTVIK